MRIIGFTNAAPASTLPFWITPVHALVPWLQRLKDSLVLRMDGAPAQREVGDAPALTRGMAASNDPVFADVPQAARRPDTLPQAGHGHALRVVRESDTALRVDCAGRMVMSGKIADICAELDRMALRAARAEG